MKIGKARHFILPNGSTACGIVGVQYLTIEAAHCDCLRCKRTKKYKNAIKQIKPIRIKSRENTTGPVQVNKTDSPGMSVFCVQAYRWGDVNCHSYTVGAFKSLAAAKEAKITEERFRKGLYLCEVVETLLDHPSHRQTAISISKQQMVNNQILLQSRGLNQ